MHENSVKFVLDLLTTLRDSARDARDEIIDKYADTGAFYTLEDTATEEYFDGKVTAYDDAIDAIEKEINAHVQS